MKFMFQVMNWYAGWDTIRKAIHVADDLGFWAVLMPEHYMYGPKYNNDSTLESWTALTYLSAITRTIKLGTLVTPIPFRPPAMLAKQVSTLDVISGGRTVLGVGAGWDGGEPEYNGYSEWNEPKIRVDKTIEGIELIMKLWTSGQNEKVNFQGKYYRAIDAVLEPKPAQKPHPPLLFGGAHKRMLRVAGKYANICVMPSRDGLTFETSRQIVLESAKKFSRQNEISFVRTLFQKEKYVPELLVQRISEAKEQGCGYFITEFPMATLVDSMKLFAKDIIPSFS